ncbi:hypothetical protein T492DRAFT_1013745, partial [Pavlovales sp. CCMP2436]
MSVGGFWLAVCQVQASQADLSALTQAPTHYAEYINMQEPIQKAVSYIHECIYEIIDGCPPFPPSFFFLFFFYTWCPTAPKVDLNVHI